MSNVAALRLGRWLDAPPGDFTAHNASDLAELLKERQEDIRIVSMVWDAVETSHVDGEMVGALAKLFGQFLVRILMAESNGS
jgi:hypothetical protein